MGFVLFLLFLAITAFVLSAFIRAQTKGGKKQGARAILAKGKLPTGASVNYMASRLERYKDDPEALELASQLRSQFQSGERR